MIYVCMASTDDQIIDCHSIDISGDMDMLHMMLLTTQMLT